MSVFEYEIINEEEQVGMGNNVLSIEELKAFTIEIAIECKFELIDSSGWMEYINHGEFIGQGYALKSFKEGLSEDTCFGV